MMNFDHLLGFAGVTSGCKWYFVKKLKRRRWLLPQEKLKVEIFRALLLLNAMNVIKAVKVWKDWTIKNLVKYNLEVFCFFKKN